MFDLVIFAEKKQSQTLQRSILGIPLFERVARRLTRNGAERIVLVGDINTSELLNLSSVSALNGEMSISRGLPDFQLIPPKSGKVIFWESNLIADNTLVESLIEQSSAEGCPVFATSERCPETPVAMAVPVEALETLENSRCIKNVAELAEQLKTSPRPPSPIKSKPEFAIMDNESKAQRNIEDALLNELRKPMEVDGFLGALVYRIFSLPISRRISKLPITPNHVTALALILGLCGAGAMASGTELGFLLGALLLQLGAVIDCVDGEIARLKYLGSLEGAWFDTVADDIVNNSFILGTGIGLARYHHEAWPLLVAVLAVLTIIPGLSFLYRGLLEQGSGDLCDFDWKSEDTEKKQSSGLQGQIANGVKYLVKRDVYVTLFLVAVLAGVPEFIPVAGFIGALGFSITVAREAQFRRANTPPRSPSRVSNTQSQATS